MPSEPKTVTLDPQKARDLRWPLGIALALIVTVLVNVAFIYIAVSGADDVVPTYQTEPR